MARFRFRAVTGAGEFVEGELEAPDQAAVIAQLRERGHLPLAAEPVAGGAAPAAARCRSGCASRCSAAAGCAAPRSRSSPASSRRCSMPA